MKCETCGIEKATAIIKGKQVCQDCYKIHYKKSKREWDIVQPIRNKLKQYLMPLPSREKI